MPHPDFPDSKTYNAMESGLSRMRYVQGTTGSGGAIQASDLADSISYAGTLAPGTYDRAAVLALVGGGATKLASMTVTVAAGTMDFEQQGTISNLPVGSFIDKPFIEGAAIDDFTITVDAGSSARLEAIGV